MNDRALDMFPWRRSRGSPDLTRPHFCSKSASVSLCRDEDWRENDGALNTFSQVFPRVPDEHPNCYVGAKELRNGLVMKPGVWYVFSALFDHI